MSTIGITALGSGRFEIDLSNAQGKTLTQLLAEKSIDLTGQTVTVNGTRLSAAAAGSVYVQPGDEIEIAAKSDAGC